VLGLLVFAPPVLANTIATMKRHEEDVHALQGLQRLLAAAAGADTFTQQDMLRCIEVRGQQWSMIWVCVLFVLDSVCSAAIRDCKPHASSHHMRPHARKVCLVPASMYHTAASPHTVAALPLVAHHRSTAPHPLTCRPQAHPPQPTR
jgi:hypothetical protein